MGGNSAKQPHPGDGRTKVSRASDVSLVVTRVFDAPPRIVYKAWTTAELFIQWWAPKSLGVPMRSCDIDARTGGRYSVTFGRDESESMTFFGRYLDVVPDQKLVWTNEENDTGAVTSVTFAPHGNGQTLLTLTESYPTKQALDEAIGGMEGGLPEQFDQLDAVWPSVG